MLIYVALTKSFIPRWALFYPLVKPEISVCIPHFLYIRGKQFPFYTTLFPASLIYNRETISILYYFVSRISYIYSIMWNKTTYILDLCIIKGNKVKFQEKLLFREGSRFFWHSFCPERSENPRGKVIFPGTFLCISYNTQIEYIGSFIPHDRVFLHNSGIR